MRYHEPFVLFSRPTPSGKKIFYYYVWDELGRRKRFSTGLAKKTDARRFCLERFRSGQLPTFAEYTKDLFVWDKCPCPRYDASSSTTS